MTTHITNDDIRLFLSRRLARQRVEEIGAHIRGCAECARRLNQSDDFAATTASLFDDPKAPRARGRRLLAAAAIVAVAVIGALFVFQRRVTPPAPSPPSRPAASIDYGRADWNEAVRAAVATRRLATPPLLDQLRPREATLRGTAASADVRVVAPVGVVVESQRPTFVWSAPPNTTVRVVVATDDTVVVTSPALTGKSWTADRPLEPGRYAWQLRIDSGTRSIVVPAPGAQPALFAVADRAAIADIAAARARGDHLLLGVVLARHGVVDAAAEEVDRLAGQHPSWTLPGALRQSLRAQEPEPTSTKADQ